MNLPDYHDIIKYPMDLTTIKNRLENRYYDGLKDCQLDFDTMFANHEMYFLGEDEIYQQGVELEKYFRAVLELSLIHIDAADE